MAKRDDVTLRTEGNVGVHVDDRNAIQNLVGVGVLHRLGLVPRTEGDSGRVDAEAVREEGLDLLRGANVGPLAQGVVDTLSAEGLQTVYMSVCHSNQGVYLKLTS
jgi:hypothetical protein